MNSMDLRLVLTRANIAKITSTLKTALVIKNFILYSASALALRSTSIILVPFILRELEPHDYGTLSLVSTFTIIATACVGLGLRQVISIEFFHHDREGRNQLITDIILIYSLAAIPFFLVVWTMRTYIIQYVFFNTIGSAQLAPILITIFLFFYAELYYQLLQYEQKTGSFIVAQGITTSTSTAITLISLWFYQAGIEGIIWAQACGTIVGTFLFLPTIKHYVSPKKIRESLAKVGYYLLYGLPFIPGIICSWILSSSNRWILAHYHSIHEVGIYATADLFTQLFAALILIPWSSAYLPYIMNRYAQHRDNIADIERENKKAMLLSMIGILLVIVASSLCIKSLLYHVIPSAYHRALPYATILLFGQLFLLGSYFASSLIQFYKKTYFLVLALALTALCNLALNSVLTPYAGIAGCATATLISYIIYFIISYFYSKHLVN